MTARDLTLLIGICALWAMNTVISGYVIAPHHLTAAGTSPLFYAALRFAVVAVVTLPWLLPAPRPTWRMGAVGLLMGAASFGLLFMGLRTASPASVGVVSQVGVPITTLLSIVMLGEVVRWKRWAGIALSLAGVLIVMWDPHGLSVSTGLLLVVASSAAGSLGAVMMKQADGVRPLQFQAWVGASSFPVMAGASLALDHGHVAQLSAGGWGLGAAVLFSGLAVSVGAHTGYYGLIQKYEATLVAPLTLMTPLMTILFGVLLNGDRFDGRMALGTGVALSGVLVIALRRNHVAPLVLLLRSRA